ncbi:MAG TPA: hypothetical protein VNH13_08740, partial [Candidatus Acidoferrales bacterium]|nr:hypothetical protein [Candidatus Acidoferrales bacterium]
MAAGSGGIWVVAETNTDGSLAKSATELATLARTLSDGGAGPATGVVVAPDPAAAAKELATHLARVVAIADPGLTDHAWGQPA